MPDTALKFQTYTTANSLLTPVLLSVGQLGPFLVYILIIMSSLIDFLLRLDMAGVAGVVVGVLVVMVLVYTCGLLTGLLVVRCSNYLHTSTTPAQPDTAAVQLPPTYEEVLSPTPASIPLQDNLSYAHI